MRKENPELWEELGVKKTEEFPPVMEVVTAFAEARKKAGLTQNELARRTGISQVNISKMERGHANPSLRTLIRIAEGMDMVMRVELTPGERKR